jgi:subtilisin family serine protease
MPDHDEISVELSTETVKFDLGLRAAFLAWQVSPDPDASMAITVVYTDDLSSIEAAGFQTHSDFDGQAVGVVRFADMVSLAANDQVAQLIAGLPQIAQLDKAAPDIRARAATLSSGTPANGVWYVDATTGNLTATTPTGSGKDVIVAVIDSGIDYTHPMFHASLGPPITTRIVGIWDQGLTPASGQSGPDVSLLASNDTYGVQFDQTAIQAALNGGAALPHQDCLGHGTHVAGIAAGGPAVAPAYPAKYVGIAPAAFIIMVKTVDIAGPVTFKNGGTVSDDVRLKDAVMYCLRLANHMGKPVVINVSLESSGLPGDGLDPMAAWVDGLVSPSASTALHPTKGTPVGFPKGAIVVKGAGNRHGQGLTGRVSVPAGGSVTVPVTLSDNRGGASTHRVNCQSAPFSPTLAVRLWYRPPSGSTLTFGLRTNHCASGVFATINQFGWGDLGIIALAGPPALDTMVASYGGSSQFHVLVTNGSTKVKDPRGGTFDLGFLEVAVEPRKTGTGFLYHEAEYQIQVSATTATDVYVDAEVAFSNAGGNVRFQLSSFALDESTIIDPWGSNVITVGAYRVDTPATFSSTWAGVPAHGAAWFSGRGPLRDFSAAMRGALAPKPDIAAPGVDVWSAASKDAASGLTPPLPAGWTAGNRFVSKGGTSMAAPMVAGVIALMLERNKTLNADDVRKILKFGAHGAPSYLTPTKTTQAYGLGMVDALASLLGTP